jgi:hypothetical protein
MDRYRQVWIQGFLYGAACAAALIFLFWVSGWF